MSKYALTNLGASTVSIGKEIAEVLAEKNITLFLQREKKHRLIDLISELKQKYDISADYITSILQIGMHHKLYMIFVNQKIMMLRFCK